MKARTELWVRGLAVALSLFVLFEVNYPHLAPQSQLAIFALLGIVVCILSSPARRGAEPSPGWRALDLTLATLATLACGYVVVQTEPLFEPLWLGGLQLGDRAGAELPIDFVVGGVGLLVVLEATRRAVGLALPILSGVFLLYAYFGPLLPDWLFPHRGYGLPRIVSQTFLHSQGVFGTALKVMFTYVFLFVLFGALLELCGATQFILDGAQRFFRGAAGAPAKVSVLSSGLMGSLSGSAVANTATTGTFTIPLMRNSGFERHVAAGVEAAASSGGALVPPVMGAGAYMMLEIIDPPVTYVQILKAALLPAVLYYLSLFLIVHFYARRLSFGGVSSSPPVDASARVRDREEGALPAEAPSAPAERAPPPPRRWEGAIFVAALATLVGLILGGYSVFRAVTWALGVVVAIAALHPRSRLGLRSIVEAMTRAARAGVALICAAASVGIVIGVVTLTGIGTKLPATILPLAEESLFLALLLIMVSSIILGMGLPSAVCYLLMATLVGPVLAKLGVVPLAAHLFIFYFGMMSMVTPPVALAAYTAATIAGSAIMRSGVAAMRFALVGFTLPYMFVYRPELLLLTPEGATPGLLVVAAGLVVAVLGIASFAAGIAGHLFHDLGTGMRAALLVSSALLLFPQQGQLIEGYSLSWINLVGGVLFAGLVAFDWRRSRLLGLPAS